MFSFFANLHPKRLFLNFIGRQQHFSGCSCCGNTWNWAQSKNIPYTENRSMFPLCVECFDKLETPEIIYHCKALFQSWMIENPDRNEPWHAHTVAAAESVRRMKERTSPTLAVM